MKLYTTLTLLLFGLFIGMAQPHFNKRNKEKIHQLKIAYFTEALELTEKEAEQFWPIYNAFEEKNHTLRREGFGSIKKEMRNFDDLSEAKAKKLLQKLEAAEQKLHENKKEFTQKLQSVLPAKKIIRLKKAEMDFNRKLIKRFRDHRGKRKSMP